MDAPRVSARRPSHRWGGERKKKKKNTAGTALSSERKLEGRQQSHLDKLQLTTNARRPLPSGGGGLSSRRPRQGLFFFNGRMSSVKPSVRTRTSHFGTSKIKHQQSRSAFCGGEAVGNLFFLFSSPSSLECGRFPKGRRSRSAQSSGSRLSVPPSLMPVYIRPDPDPDDLRLRVQGYIS